jgi:hypothetical protein
MPIKMVQLSIFKSNNIGVTGDVQWRYYASLSSCTTTNTRVVDEYALFGYMNENALVYDFNFYTGDYLEGIFGCEFLS